MSVAAPDITAGHVIRGRYVEGADVEHRASGGIFRTPALDLDELVWPRTEPGPAFDVPLAEIIDFLAATGERLNLESNEVLQESFEAMTRMSPLSRRVVENMYRSLPTFFERESMELTADLQVGIDVLDGWRVVRGVGGEVTGEIRAYPPRLVHMLAGNSIGVTAVTIVRSALTKGVHLLKLPSNDLFSATAILRTMAEIDPSHPVLQSFSAVYWRGGDDSVENVIYRPQFFDKLVAWGGEAAIRHALKYIGPGFELVSFDPKVSISVIGREAFESEERLREVAAAAATDVACLNQDACVASRHQYVEASVEDTDRFCELLAEELAVDREVSDAIGPATPSELREEMSVLRYLEPDYRIFGSEDGSGVVIRSLDPVTFPLSAKTVNVVPVPLLRDAARHANVATQTVGVFPIERKPELRDAMAAAGAQRLVPLGRAGTEAVGMPHDGMFPLHRLVRWVADEHQPQSTEPTTGDDQ